MHGNGKNRSEMGIFMVFGFHFAVKDTKNIFINKKYGHFVKKQLTTAHHINIIYEKIETPRLLWQNIKNVNAVS